MPILGPDSGLIGYRIKKNGLGETYEYGNINDLYQQWKYFKQKPLDQYSSAIRKYIKQFNAASLSECIRIVLLEN